MTDRDVNIKVTEDASQAKAENASLKDSIGGVTSVGEKQLEVIDGNTKILGTAAKSYDAATLAALGFKVAEEESTAATELGTTARAQLNNAENVLTLSRSRAIRAAIDQAAAELGAKDAIAGHAGQIIAVIAAAAAYNFVADQMNERGFKMVTLGQLLEKGFDAVSEAFGGTSKAALEVSRSFDEASTKIDVAAASINHFTTLAELFGRAGANEKNVLDALTVAALNATGKTDMLSVSQGELAARSTLAGEKLNTFFENAKKANELNPDKVAALVAQLVAIDANAPGAAKEIDDVTSQMRGLADESTAADKAFGSMGKSADAARAAFGQVEAVAPILVKEIRDMQAAGLSWEEIWKAVGPQVSAVNAEVAKFTPVLKDLHGEVIDDIDALAQFAEKHDVVADAVKKHEIAEIAAAKAEEDRERKVYDLVEALEAERKKHIETVAAIELHRQEQNAAIADSTAKTVAALDTQIDALVKKENFDAADANKLNDLLGQESAARKKALDQTVANNTAAALSEEEEAKRDTKAKSDIIGKLKDLGESLESAQKTHDKYKAHVEAVISVMEDQALKAAAAAEAHVAAGNRLEKEASPKVESHAKLHERVVTALAAVPGATTTAGESLSNFGDKCVALGDKLDAIRVHIASVDALGAAFDRVGEKADVLAGKIASLSGGAGGPLGGALSAGGDSGTGGVPTGESFGPSAPNASTFVTSTGG